jgi:D-glycero-alpha-D-manno-heptose 1-phosphate guanylyltransferase
MVKPILVLAGGFGSRLKSLVSNVPKPLAPVCGKPFLMYLLENLYALGAREFVFLLHYEADSIKRMIEEVMNNDDLDGVKIISLVEDMPLGTGGSIMNAINVLNIDESFMVVNADTWLGSGFKQLSLSSPNSIAAVSVEDCSRYGALVVIDGKIERFLEKKSSYGSGLINAGLYHLSPDIFNQIRDDTSFSLETDIFPSVVDRGMLSAIEINTDFIDIGVPEDYLRFCRWIESGKENEL